VTQFFNFVFLEWKETNVILICYHLNTLLIIFTSLSILFSGCDSIFLFCFFWNRKETLTNWNTIICQIYHKINLVVNKAKCIDFYVYSYKGSWLVCICILLFTLGNVTIVLGLKRNLFITNSDIRGFLRSDKKILNMLPIEWLVSYYILLFTLGNTTCTLSKEKSVFCL
jgi:hypothetical protein